MEKFGLTLLLGNFYALRKGQMGGFRHEAECLYNIGSKHLSSLFEAASNVTMLLPMLVTVAISGLIVSVISM